MKVTYLGNKKEMILFGYDFSESKTQEVSEDNELIVKKFKGNRYFYCDTDDNHVAPAFYVCPIKKVVTGSKFKKVTENLKLAGFATEQEAEIWIKSHGKIGVTHVIRKSDEDIADMPGKKKDIFAVFKMKIDGKLYTKPEKTFKSKEEAEDWMLENDKVEGHKIMVK